MKLAERGAIRTYRNIILLILLALLLHALMFDRAYWVRWIGGVMVPGALIVYAVYLLPKRPWQR